MLNWPDEIIHPDSDMPKWGHAVSNMFLDFHGDPASAKLVVFSDGNHHMALKDVLQAFYEKNPSAGQIFYATTPPGPILELLKHKRLQVGNFVLSVTPHVFISPPHVLDMLADAGYIRKRISFMKNRGNVLLIKKGNPKNISGIADLERKDVRLFLSSPSNESVSYKSYVNTLKSIAGREGVDLAFLTETSADKRIVYGERIHHREAPQAVADGTADVAIVYYHLALRYTRVFPDFFEIVPLGGTALDPRPVSGNVISLSHAGLIGEAGQWGLKFLDFLLTDTVTEIYAYHGLLRAEEKN